MPPNDQPVSNAGVTPVKFTNVLPAVAIIYAVFIMLGIVNHEPWRDEAQAWLIVRDAGFTDLFSILRTEGHPPLWYLLILPLAKAGLPYAAQNWLAGIICMAAVYIFLFKTKLPLIVKNIVAIFLLHFL